MFTDMKEALEAEALELTPLGSDQHSAASVVVAHHARDKADLADLLGALGLPCTEDDLVRLLPHLITPTTTSRPEIRCPSTPSPPPPPPCSTTATIPSTSASRSDCRRANSPTL
ncbi:hypothetical protein ACWGIA_21520 [Streptomyces bobili]|nr:hypothetical protein GCM10010350_71980 [Streptomyces galilaeus]